MASLKCPFLWEVPIAPLSEAPRQYNVNPYYNINHTLALIMFRCMSVIPPLDSDHVKIRDFAFLFSKYFPRA